MQRGRGAGRQPRTREANRTDGARGARGWFQRRDRKYCVATARGGHVDAAPFGGGAAERLLSWRSSRQSKDSACATLTFIFSRPVLLSALSLRWNDGARDKAHELHAPRTVRVAVVREWRTSDKPLENIMRSRSKYLPK